MGQSLSTCLGYLIIFYYQLQEKVKSVLYGAKKEKGSYFNHDIILKEDEHQADILSSEEINKIIKKQQSMQKASPNLNEYKIIKNTIEMEEAESLTNTSAEKEESKEIHEIKKEVIHLHLDEDNEKLEAEPNENIEELKASVLNVNDD